MRDISAIVYTSNTGFTMRYAQMLSQATAIPAYDLDESSVPAAGAKILYLGWLSAGRIKGLSKANRRWDIQAVCAVGMSPNNDPNTLRETNHVNCPLFYAQGGYAPDKLHGMDKLVMAIITKLIASTQKKKVKSPEEAEQLAQFQRGCDFVDGANLEPVLAWLRDGDRP